MYEFWEQTFETEKTNWGFEPADSSIYAMHFFKEKDLKKILIPGVGYGRNASPFLQNGFDVTGIEISNTAIDLARENGFSFPIFHGPVNKMPFDQSIYDGIFCYSMIHLLNKPERKHFLNNCFNQLAIGGYMFFTVISTESEMFKTGTFLSQHRYQLRKGLKVYFYDAKSVKSEFNNVGLLTFKNIDEPVKHMKDAAPMKCYSIICHKPF